MPCIPQFSDDEASGDAERELDAARQRTLATNPTGATVTNLCAGRVGD